MSAPPTLRAGLLVQACLRRANARGTPAFVVRRGYPEAGAVFLKLNRLDGTCTVLSQIRRPDGVLGWLRATGAAPVPEADADAYLERQARFDPDIWVLEIEDREGRHPLDEPVSD